MHVSLMSTFRNIKDYEIKTDLGSASYYFTEYKYDSPISNPRGENIILKGMKTTDDENIRIQDRYIILKMPELHDASQESLLLNYFPYRGR